MQAMLKLSRAIDRLSNAIGRLTWGLVLVVSLISAGNAVVRKAFGVSSNAMLETQWYLFAAVFMLGGGYAFLNNAHVRIDVLASRWSARARHWVDIVGIVVFLLPLCWLMVHEGWPLFQRAWVSGEMSTNAGGLIRWPVYLLIPLGFALLALQAVSELIKRAHFLWGQGPDLLTAEADRHDEGVAVERPAAQEGPQ